MADELRTEQHEELREEIVIALCTDHGHATRANAASCRTCNRRADAIMDIIAPTLEEIQGYKQLFDTQWTRSREADALWQSEKPEERANVWPDLGKLLEWLMARSTPPSDEPLGMIYDNHAGIVAERLVRPVRLWFGSTEWHEEPQWLLQAYDVDKDAMRDYALSGVRGFNMPNPCRACGDRGWYMANGEEYTCACRAGEAYQGGDDATS